MEEQLLDNHTKKIVKMEHPSAASIQTLGILGLVFTFLLGIVGLILNIIALSKAGNATREIQAEPDKYYETSLSKIRAGRTCAIIGLSLQALAIIVVILIAGANS